MVALFKKNKKRKPIMGLSAFTSFTFHLYFTWKTSSRFELFVILRKNHVNQDDVYGTPKCLILNNKRTFIFHQNLKHLLKGVYFVPFGFCRILFYFSWQWLPLSSASKPSNCCCRLSSVQKQCARQCSVSCPADSKIRERALTFTAFSEKPSSRGSSDKPVYFS